MDEKATELAALLSLKPRFAEAILSGVKECEFRRSTLGRNISFVIIYATMPVGQILGYAKVSKVEEGCPKVLWQRFHPVGGVSEEEFFEYFSNASSGTAISLNSPVRLPGGIDLKELSESLRAPQSFLYLDASAIHRLNEVSKPSKHH